MLVAALGLFFGAPSATAAVLIESLPTLSSETIGLTTGLAPQMWQGASKKRLTFLMEEITKRPLTPALREVVAALLATESGEAPPPMDGFLAWRLDGLLALGEAEKVLDIIERIPEADMTNDVRLRHLAALSMLGQYETVLALSTQMPAGGEAYRINALLALGRRAEAELAFDVLMENHEADEKLAALGNRVFRAGTDKVPAADSADIWATAALRAELANGLPAPDKRTRGVHRLLMSLPNATPADRLAGAEVVGDMALAAALDLSAANKTDPSIQRAEAWQAFIRAETPKDKAKKLKIWADTAQKAGVFMPAAEALITAGAALSPAPETAPAAEALFLAAALTENASVAEMWLPFLSSEEQLRMSVLANQLGMGLPKTEPARVEACLQKETPACQVYMRQMPTYFPVGTDKVFDLKPVSEAAYPAIVCAALEELRAEGKQGRMVLEVVRLLAASENPERCVLRQLAHVIPLGWVKRIEMERLIINGR